jgi:hypothetical protein
MYLRLRSGRISGTALYPTLIFLNHSCAPNTIRINHGPKVGVCPSTIYHLAARIVSKSARSREQPRQEKPIPLLVPKNGRIRCNGLQKQIPFQIIYWIVRKKIAYGPAVVTWSKVFITVIIKQGPMVSPAGGTGPFLIKRGQWSRSSQLAHFIKIRNVTTPPV